jgi:hypothetical protein
MKRMIDANEVNDRLDNVIIGALFAKDNKYAEAIQNVRCIINEQPTEDIVEVVRCKDCVNRGLPYDCPMIPTIDDFDENYDHWTDDDDFCSSGKRDG